jgi:hypothetical protein
MKEFMFIYRSGDSNWMANRSADERAAVMAKWGAWIGAISAKGQLVTGGSPLEFGGKRLKKDGVLTDLAAAELKELVSGYSIIKAEDYEQAAAIARECPIFAGPNTSLEIRVVAAM